ncbi:unnamed protein product [Prunus brigantina]
MGLKVDMNKAYDRVEWDFLEAILEKMGLCNGWVRLVTTCVNSVYFAILLNGNPGPSSNRIYSVKSGYHCLHSVNRLSLTESSHSSVSIPVLVWKALWKIRTLPKIKNFLWRVMANAIPTRLNLHKRKIISYPHCPLCEDYKESIEHILFLCPWTKLVWFASPLTYKVDF